MKRLSQFGMFWYDFIVGDDWTIAAAVVVIIALTAVVAHAGYVAWPILPLGVTIALGVSLNRAYRTHRRATAPAAHPDPDRP